MCVSYFFLLTYPVTSFACRSWVCFGCQSCLPFVLVFFFALNLSGHSHQICPSPVLLVHFNRSCRKKVCYAFKHLEECNKPCRFHHRILVRPRVELAPIAMHRIFNTSRCSSWKTYTVKVRVKQMNNTSRDIYSWLTSALQCPDEPVD